MLVSSALAVVLAADPSAAVVLARRTSVSAVDASALTTLVTASLEADGAPVLPSDETSRLFTKARQKDATFCRGKPSCLTELAAQLEVPALILVSVARVGKDRSIALELFLASTGDVVEEDSAVLDKWDHLSEGLWKDFSGRVSLRLAPPPPVEPPPPPGPPVDVPPVVKLTPEPPPSPPQVVAPTPSKSHATAWVTGGLGVAALVGAGVLFAVGGATYSSLSQGTRQPDGVVLSDLTTSEAQARAASTNLLFGLATGAAVVGLGLGTTAVLTW